MNLFDNCIVLRVPSCYRFPFYDIVILTHIGKFSDRFGTTIKRNSLWKWVTSEPSFRIISVGIKVIGLSEVNINWSKIPI